MLCRDHHDISSRLARAVAKRHRLIEPYRKTIVACAGFVGDFGTAGQDDFDELDERREGRGRGTAAFSSIMGRVFWKSIRGTAN
jgi:hypothetical protein